MTSHVVPGEPTGVVLIGRTAASDGTVLAGAWEDGTIPQQLLALVMRTRGFTAWRTRRSQWAEEPVLTVDETFRAEVVSRCRTTYVRADLPAPAGSADGATLQLDPSPDFDRQLATLPAGAPLRLEVRGHAGRTGSFNLPAPLRRALTDVATASSQMTLGADLDIGAARRLLTQMMGTAQMEDAWLRLDEDTPQPAQPRDLDAARIAAPHRLRLVTPLLRHLRRLRLYTFEPLAGISGWELDLGSARVTVVLSGDAPTGFSLGSQVLRLVADAASETDTPPLVVDSDGRAGYDFRGGMWFLRYLTGTRNVHPRLEAARQLVEEGHVMLDAAGSGALVAGSHDVYLVRQVGDEWWCECRWARERSSPHAGPCKHILAAQLSSGKRE